MHKQSAVRLKLNGDRRRGSNDRLLRVRGAWRKETGVGIEGVDARAVDPASCMQMNVGDPFATLVHMPDGAVTLLFLALAKRPLEAAGDAQTLCGYRIRLIEVESSPVCGQEVSNTAGGSMQPTAGEEEGSALPASLPLEDDGVAGEEQGSSEPGQGCGQQGASEGRAANFRGAHFLNRRWQWDGGRVVQGQHQVPAKLALPLDPDLNAKLTHFAFRASELSQLLSRLELLVEGTSNGRSKLLRLKGDLRDLPYDESLCSSSLASQYAGETLSDILRCRICNFEIHVDSMREHVGGHILNKIVSFVHLTRFRAGSFLRVPCVLMSVCD